MRKIFLFALTIMCVEFGFSQTKIISHKSHSGEMSTFSSASTGNFGLGERMFQYHVDTVIKVNDTFAIEVRTYSHMGDKERLELVHPAFFSIPLKKLKEMHPTTVFVGFEKEKKSKKKENGYFIFDGPVDNTGLYILSILCFALMVSLYFYIRKYNNSILISE